MFPPTPTPSCPQGRLQFSLGYFFLRRHRWIFSIGSQSLPFFTFLAGGSWAAASATAAASAAASAAGAASAADTERESGAGSSSSSSSDFDVTGFNEAPLVGLAAGWQDLLLDDDLSLGFALGGRGPHGRCVAAPAFGDGRRIGDRVAAVVLGGDGGGRGETDRVVLDLPLLGPRGAGARRRPEPLLRFFIPGSGRGGNFVWGGARGRRGGGDAVAPPSRSRRGGGDAGARRAGLERLLAARESLLLGSRGARPRRVSSRSREYWEHG